MLIRFQAENTRSIADRIELSAIATEDQSLLENTIDVPQHGIRLLKTMALFGANASGKSNILKAIADSSSLITNIDGKSQLNHRFNRTSNKLSTFDTISYRYEIIVNDTYFDYSFSFDQEKIVEETLIKNSSELVFKRQFNSEKSYHWEPSSFIKDENVLFFYKSTPPDRLFLTVANNPINPDAVQKIADLEQIYQWFSDQLIEPHIGLIFTGVHIDFNPLIRIIESDKKEFLIKLLQIADISIVDLDIIRLIEDQSTNDTVTKVKVENENGQNEYVSIRTAHNTDRGNDRRIYFDFFTQESNGTQQFLAWLGYWLYHLQKGKQPKIFVVDELGTSMHPLLTQLLMRIFYSGKLNPHQSQLIFTTHEVKLMDKSIMRTDQLYLVSKHNEKTSIESAADYPELDKFARLDNSYMHGAIGAVPGISDQDIDTLLP